MHIICGPINNLRNVDIDLPVKKERLGVFVSGGLDSAILYFLLLLENKKLNNLHDVVPYTLFRKEGSSYAAAPVIEHIHRSLNIPLVRARKVGDTTLPEPQQVGSGISEARSHGMDKIYAGLIQQLPQHMINWKPIPYKETEIFKTPFSHLDKSHIVDLISRFNQACIYHITHSCVLDIGRCNMCNGCNERSWGFDQLSMIDPGRY